MINGLFVVSQKNKKKSTDVGYDKEKNKDTRECKPFKNIEALGMVLKHTNHLERRVYNDTCNRYAFNTNKT